MANRITLPIDNQTFTRKTILLVEDDPRDQELTIRALRKSNVLNRVLLAHDGEEALDILLGGTLHGLEGLPAVVLLDLKLPKLSGWEVLRAIRSDPRTCNIPVVILTGLDDEEDVEQGYALGANSYICKPIDFEKFSEAVGQLGCYWMLLNEPPPAVIARQVSAVS